MGCRWSEVQILSPRPIIKAVPEPNSIFNLLRYCFLIAREIHAAWARAAYHSQSIAFRPGRHWHFNVGALL